MVFMVYSMDFEEKLITLLRYHYLTIPHTELFKIQYFVYLGKNRGEGNGTPLQYSCLENPMDGGAW